MTSLASLCLLSLPACHISNTSLDPGNRTTVTRFRYVNINFHGIVCTQYLHRCSVVLVFITTLVSALLVTALVSWLSVATFWLSLAHTQPRLDTEHEVVIVLLSS